MKYLVLYIASIIGCSLICDQQRTYIDIGTINPPNYMDTMNLPVLKDSVYIDTLLSIFKWNEQNPTTKFIKPVIDDFVESSFRRNVINNLYFYRYPSKVAYINNGISDTISTEAYCVSTIYENLGMALKTLSDIVPCNVSGVLVYDALEYESIKPILCYILSPIDCPQDYSNLFDKDCSKLEYKIIGPNYIPGRILIPIDDRLDNIYKGILIHDSIKILDYVYEGIEYIRPMPDFQNLLKLKEYKDKFNGLGIDVFE